MHNVSLTRPYFIMDGSIPSELAVTQHSELFYWYSSLIWRRCTEMMQDAKAGQDATLWLSSLLYHSTCACEAECDRSYSSIRAEPSRKVQQL